VRHRIGLILQSSNTVWAVPGSSGVVNIAHGPIRDVTAVGTSLTLPLENAPAFSSVRLSPGARRGRLAFLRG
jgi:hypothetical protein